MVLQVPDQVAAEVADISFEFPDVVPEAVQLGDNDLVTVRAAVAVAPADDSPGHDDDQDSDGSDYLSQPSQVLQLYTPLYAQHLAYLSVGYRIGGQLGM